MPGAPHTLGLDIGGTSTKIVVLDAAGTETYRASSSSYDRPDAARLGEGVRTLIQGAGLGGRPPVVGLCVPGKFEPDGETVAYSANLPALTGLHVPGFLREILGSSPARLRILPDAQASALGSWKGSPHRGRLLAICLGTGVGVGLLEGGRPVTLAPGTSGHLGQIDVSLSPDAPIGPDGGRGSLEAYIGLPALRVRFGDALAEAIATVPDDDPVLLALARAIRIAHAIYTPDEVRLLGGVGIALTPKLAALRSLVDRDLTAVARPGWALTAENDPYLAALGAASAAASPP